MSREIEFRAWDDEYRVFDNDFFISSSGVAFDYASLRCDTPNTEIERKPDFIIEQYTGLKDCNDVKMFESDILRCENDYIWVVSKDDVGRFIAHEPKNILDFLFLDDADFEVIGNIHQNPELITG